MSARWRNRLLDAGIVAYFVALPVAAFISRWAGLALLAFFLVATSPSLFAGALPPWGRR